MDEFMYDEYKDNDDEIYELEEPYEQSKPYITFAQREQYQQSFGYGFAATTAEGKLGEKLRKVALYSRTDEERFNDNIMHLSQQFSFHPSTVNEIAKLIDIIPDIKYKSPVCVLLGYKIMNYVGINNLNDVQKKEINFIFSLIKHHELKINELDIIRYARFLRKCVKDNKEYTELNKPVTIPFEPEKIKVIPVRETIVTEDKTKKFIRKVKK